VGKRCELPERVWGKVLSKIEFRAFQPHNVTSGGNNLNDFPENRLTKFRAVYTVKVNRSGTKSLSSVVYAMRMDSLGKKWHHKSLDGVSKPLGPHYDAS